jgi:thymidylate kinase
LKNVSFIAVIGPDGVGKTTLVNEVSDKIKNVYGLNVIHKASNFEILPTFSQILKVFGLRSEANRNVEGYKGYLSGMDQEPNSILKSMILVLWYCLDLNLGRFKIKKARSQKELFFFARYFYDYYFQIANRNIPVWFLNFIIKFVPKPDFVFYIKRNSKDIFEGKPELSIEEIERQQQIIEVLVKKNNHFVVVNGDKGINSSVKFVLETVAGKA